TGLSLHRRASTADPCWNATLPSVYAPSRHEGNSAKRRGSGVIRTIETRATQNDAPHSRIGRGRGNFRSRSKTKGGSHSAADIPNGGGQGCSRIYRGSPDCEKEATGR